MQTIDHSLNIIEIKNISFSYDKEKILDDVTFNIHKGDYVGIIGPNGGGKTTLLKIILGLLSPQKGTISLFGKNRTTFNQWARIGYVPQNAARSDSRFPATVEEVVGMGLYGKKGLFNRLDAYDKKTIDEVMKSVGIEKYRNHLLSDLSGGQQQRVYIARALVSDPEVLLLDEPTIGVDLEQQEKFYALLKKLNGEKHITLVLITHELDVVAHEATEFACLNQRLVYHGAPKDFMQGDYLAKLYGHGLKFIVHNH